MQRLDTAGDQFWQHWLEQEIVLGADEGDAYIAAAAQPFLELKGGVAATEATAEDEHLVAAWSFEPEAAGADAQFIAGPQGRRAAQAALIDVSATARVEVAHGHPAVANHQLGVAGRDVGVVDPERVFRVAADDQLAICQWVAQ